MELYFSSKLDQGSYIVSAVTTASKQIKILTHYTKFDFCEIFFISINLPSNFALKIDAMLDLILLNKSVRCYYCGSCSSKLIELLPLSDFFRPVHYSDKLSDFFDTIQDDVRMSIPTVSFIVQINIKSYTFRNLDSSFQSLVYDMNCCTSRVKRHLPCLSSFQEAFLYNFRMSFLTFW